MIKELRTNNGYTQNYVAKQIKVEVKTYRSWEIGYYKDNTQMYPKIDNDKLEALADLYNVSVDYILGRSEYLSVENEKIGEITGLSNDAIEMLKILSEYRAEYQAIMPGLGSDIDAINALLEYQFYITKKAESTNNLPNWSIFHFIKQYFYSDKFERELQDRLRICDGNVWVDIENGDILQKDDKQYKVMSSGAINSKTGSGTNSKTVHIFNTENPKDRYVVDVAKIFSTYSKDNIFKELDKIKEYLETKNNKERK